MGVVETAVVRKAWKLIEALAEPCETHGDADHAWATCRRCLAVEELDRRGAKRLLRALLDARKAALGAALSVERDDFTVEQRLAFAIHEGNLIAAECEQVGISGDEPIAALFERVRMMRERLQRAETAEREHARTKARLEVYETVPVCRSCARGIDAALRGGS